MKYRILALTFALLLILSACSAGKVEEKLDAIEEVVETQVDAVEETAETAVEGTTGPTVAEIIEAKPENGTLLLSEEEAKTVALQHAGFTADQVERLRCSLDYDDGRSEYEVDFQVDRTEYEYTIDAETGDILEYDSEYDD